MADAPKDPEQSGPRQARTDLPSQSTTDLSQFAQQAVDPPRRSEWWFGVGLILLICFAIGVVFALR